MFSMATLVKKKKSRDVEIPTASMADIAFLLLIFFLVTTTIDVDTGIGMTLPPKADPSTPPPPVQDRNMLTVLVNSDGRILVENEDRQLSEIRDLVIKHITNNGQDPNFSDNPKKAVVSMKTTRQTKYKDYINVLDELWLGYREVWDREARARGASSYAAYRASLPEGADNPIRDEYPAQLSIAEPDGTPPAQ